jgi:hypothetical protein
MDKNEAEKLAMTAIHLHPEITFRGDCWGGSNPGDTLERAGRLTDCRHLPCAIAFSGRRQCQYEPNPLRRRQPITGHSPQSRPVAK